MTEIPAWKQIVALFERHGLAPPPWRLRDELVMHLLAYRAENSSAEQVVSDSSQDDPK